MTLISFVFAQDAKTTDRMDEMSKYHTILGVMYEKLYIHTCNYQVMTELCYFVVYVYPAVASCFACVD